MKQKSILQESKEFVSQNIEIRANEVPTYFLHVWNLVTISAKYIEEDTYSTQYQIFIHILKEKDIKESEHSSEELLSLFHQFQILVYSAMLDRNLNFKIFDIAKYTKIIEYLQTLDTLVP